jgi:hypothetical protein
MTVTPPIVSPPSTVYEDVCALKDLLAGFLLADPPPLNWCQLGSPVTTCESWAVGTTSVHQDPLNLLGGNECQMLTTLDLIAIVARECNFEADENGFTDPAQVVAASVQQDADTTALLAWAESLARPAATSSVVSYNSEGGLAITTLTTSAYAGW